MLYMKLRASCRNQKRACARTMKCKGLLRKHTHLKSAHGLKMFSPGSSHFNSLFVAIFNLPYFNHGHCALVNKECLLLFDTEILDYNPGSVKLWEYQIDMNGEGFCTLKYVSSTKWSVQNIYAILWTQKRLDQLICSLERLSYRHVWKHCGT